MARQVRIGGWYNPPDYKMVFSSQQDFEDWRDSQPVEPELTTVSSCCDQCNGKGTLADGSKCSSCQGTGTYTTFVDLNKKPTDMPFISAIQ